MKRSSFSPVSSSRLAGYFSLHHQRGPAIEKVIGVQGSRGERASICSAIALGQTQPKKDLIDIAELLLWMATSSRPMKTIGDRSSCDLSQGNNLYVSTRMYQYPYVSVPVCIGARMYRYPYVSVPICIGARMYRYPYVSVPVCIGTRMYRCPYVSVPVCIGTRMYQCPYVSVPVCIGTRMYRCPYVSVPVCIGARMYRCPYVSVPVCISARMYQYPDRVWVSLSRAQQEQWEWPAYANRTASIVL